MISILPRIYEDEIVYSFIARYHRYSGNNSITDTKNELFGQKNFVATVYFQGYLESFYMRIGKYLGLEKNELIENHTLINYQCIFMEEKVANDLRKDCLTKSTIECEYRAGKIVGGVCRKKAIYYCPKCVQEEFDRNGEAYIHKLQQIEGILVCTKHECMLEIYPKEIKPHEYLIIEKDLVKKYIKDIDERILYEIAQGIECILNNAKELNKKELYKMQEYWLKSKGLKTEYKKVDRERLFKEFEIYYGEKFLNKFECNVQLNNYENWLNKILLESSEKVEPLRWILYMIFLAGDVETFINYKQSKSEGLLCLNHFCNNFMRNNDVEVSYKKDYKSKKVIAKVKCSCGMVYSKGINRKSGSREKIIEYGEV